MATFWDRIITEFNVAKAVEGHNGAAAKVSSTSRCASADAPEASVDLAADTDANAKQATDNDGPWTASSKPDAIDVLYSLCDKSVGEKTWASKRSARRHLPSAYPSTH